MDALVFIAAKYDLSLHRRSPIEIPNMDRRDLARLFFLLGFTRGAEVGVERGLYSEVLCQENPHLVLYCVDPWKAYRGYRDHVDQAKLDRFYEETKIRLEPYHPCYIRKRSTDAVKDFEDASLDFCYLDGNHSLENVVHDISAWSKKVRLGGIIAGHDYVRYRRHNQIHVVQAVNAYTDAYKIEPWFLVGAQAKDGQARDDARSWFWVHDPKPFTPRKWPVKQ